MSIVAILAIIGLCVILSKMSRFFTNLGKALDQIGSKMIERDYHKEYKHFEEVANMEFDEHHSKTLRQARKKILDANYEKRVREEINALTK